MHDSYSTGGYAKAEPVVISDIAANTASGNLVIDQPFLVALCILPRANVIIGRINPFVKKT